MNEIVENLTSLEVDGGVDEKVVNEIDNVMNKQQVDGDAQMDCDEEKGEGSEDGEIAEKDDGLSLIHI